MRIRAMCTTYEYECRVQILVMLLHEVLVVLLGLLVIMLVELGAEVLLWKLPILFLSVRGVNDGGRRDAKLSPPIRHWAPARPPISILLQRSSVISTAIGGQRTATLGYL